MKCNEINLYINGNKLKIKVRSISEKKNITMRYCFIDKIYSLICFQNISFVIFGLPFRISKHKRVVLGVAWKSNASSNSKLITSNLLNVCSCKLH